MFNFLLANVPLTDPTAPYHSISYLAGVAAQKKEWLGTYRDFNIEILNFMAAPQEIERLTSQCHNIIVSIESQDRLTRRDHLLYRFALSGLGLNKSAVDDAIRVLKSPQDFFDPRKYTEATHVINKWISALSVLGYPGQFQGFDVLQPHILNFASIQDLTNIKLLDVFVNPFSSYLRTNFIDILKEKDWKFVGLSANYSSQLPFLIWMCNKIRETLPNISLCIGGTEVSAIYKYLAAKNDIWRIFGHCDYIVLGEGETAFSYILDQIANDKEIEQIPGLITNHSTDKKKRMPLLNQGQREQVSANYENLKTIPSPRYDIWNWSAYWSPEPVVLYSPTRGCYWNKCTFCDYGLNTDTPTSPSRERPIHLAINELKQISTFSRIAYFAVDAMSPAYLRKLSKEMTDQGLALSWSAELRLEKTMRGNLGHELKKAGCIAVSFGYESASQRILNLIDKGVSIDNVADVIQQLTEHDIGVQMMGFVGFPTELTEEAMETYQFLLRHKSNWQLAAIGDFVLTANSIVAKQPTKFNISSVHTYDGEDIRRNMYWIDNHGQVHHPFDKLPKEITQLALSLVQPKGRRPFFGGIDSAHTLLYYHRFGSKLAPSSPSTSSQPSILSTTHESSFSIDSLVGITDLLKFHFDCQQRGKSLSFCDIEDWLTEIVEVDRIPTTIEVLMDGTVITALPEDARGKFSAAYYKIKDKIMQSYLSL